MADASMAPRILDGEFVYVDADEPVRDGRLVAVLDPETGESTVRQYVVEDGRRVLRALAAGLPDLAIDAGDETTIVGVAVFKGHAL